MYTYCTIEASPHDKDTQIWNIWQNSFDLSYYPEHIGSLAYCNNFGTSWCHCISISDFFPFKSDVMLLYSLSQSIWWNDSYYPVCVHYHIITVFNPRDIFRQWVALEGRGYAISDCLVGNWNRGSLSTNLDFDFGTLNIFDCRVKYDVWTSRVISNVFSYDFGNLSLM